MFLYLSILYSKHLSRMLWPRKVSTKRFAHVLELKYFYGNEHYQACWIPTSIPGPSRWDGDEDPGKIHFIVPKFWEKNRMRSATQPYCNNGNNGWIRLCLTAHAIFSPKFWNDKTNFTRVFVTVSPRRPWDRGWLNPNPKSSHSVDPQLSHKLLFYLHSCHDIFFIVQRHGWMRTHGCITQND